MRETEKRRAEFNKKCLEEHKKLQRALRKSKTGTKSPDKEVEDGFVSVNRSGVTGDSASKERHEQNSYKHE